LKAWKRTQHRAATRPAIHPDRERRIRRILPRLEEPEEGINLIRLIADAQVLQRPGREVDIASIALDTRCRLTQRILPPWLEPQSIAETEANMTNLLVGNPRTLDQLRLQNCYTLWLWRELGLNLRYACQSGGGGEQRESRGKHGFTLCLPLHFQLSRDGGVRAGWRGLEDSPALYTLIRVV
jgi:hypothetical protein